jgi:hypothetical protein
VRLSGNTQLDPVIRRMYQVLRGPETPFGRLDGIMTEQQLNLL